MIHIKIKVKNDHRSLTEDFEASELLLSPESPQIQEWVKKIISDFKDPVEEVIIKTSMSI